MIDIFPSATPQSGNLLAFAAPPLIRSARVAVTAAMWPHGIHQIGSWLVSQE